MTLLPVRAVGGIAGPEGQRTWPGARPSGVRPHDMPGGRRVGTGARPCRKAGAGGIAFLQHEPATTPRPAPACLTARSPTRLEGACTLIPHGDGPMSCLLAFGLGGPRP